MRQLIEGELGRMNWLVILWGIVALLVLYAYFNPGFKSATQILEEYSHRRKQVSSSPQHQTRT